MSNGIPKEVQYDSLYLAAYLLSKDCHYLGAYHTGRTTKSGQKLSAFRFTNSDGMQQHVEDYWNGQDGIKRFVNALTKLKTELRGLKAKLPIGRLPL